VFRRANITVYVPIVTSIAVSLLVTLFFAIMRR